MPIKISGIFWRTSEVADAIGMNYTAFSRKYKGREGIVVLGQTFLIPDSVAKAIMMENQNEKDKKYISPSEAHKKLNIQYPTMVKLLEYGLPYTIINEQKRIEKKTFEILEKVIQNKIKDRGYICMSDCSEIVAKVTAELKTANNK